MEQSGFVVSIDIGTSKMVGLMGRKNEQGVITILASESIPSDNCVKYGVVYNIDETAGKIKKLINLLENKSGRRIGKVYVSVNGKSLRAIEYTLTRDIGFEAEVTFNIIDRMEQQARLNKPEFLMNYSVVAPEIYLDGNHEEDYLGKTASTIEGRYRLIVGRPNIKYNLVKTITDKNQLDIAGYIVGPLATAAIVLDDADKQAGCALVDFGAGTTTLSIYKDGLLRYMVVIPFGGRTITKDIKELGFVETAAESYKIKYGKVGKDKNKDTSKNSEVDVRELNKIIQLRVEEIVMNVLNQIKESGYSGLLDAGIIMVGGASQLAGLEQFVEEKAQMPVKKGSAQRLYINNVSELLLNPSYTQCLGLLLFANENCEKPEQQPVQPANTYIDNQTISSPSSQEIAAEDEEEDEEVKKEEQKIKKEAIKEIREVKTPPRPKKTNNIFNKIRNFGGTLFDDED